MPTYFQTPENALKKAKDFIEDGRKDSALKVLNDVIRSKKHRTWTMTHESIMRLFTELCVDLKQGSFAKDGLYQYRNICKDGSLKSFETVVKAFLGLAESKANAAREESECAFLQEVKDLDVMQTPEGLLLSTVSGEGTKERTERVLLTPWVKFLWESYRNMLELLKNNQTTKRLYADVAKDAFQFCLNYQRRTEFRKLCDILRNHLTQAQRYQNQTYSLNFEDLDTVFCLVGVRFEQLECSITIDLWQESFKAIEEIHRLLNISKKAPEPDLLENFYTKQARVYWMASNRLFHAAALHKLFVFRKEQKKTLIPEEAQRIASQVLLASLSIPIEPIPSETDRFLKVNDTSRNKAKRLSGLLQMATHPTRASLLKDVVRHSILQYVPEELQQLYKYLEVEFNPLLLCKRVIPILEGLEGNETLAPYVEPVKEITIVRLIKQVSQVYVSIEFTRLMELAPFTTSFQLEKVVVETAHSNGIQVRIDHRTKSLRFGTDMTFSYMNETPEGPYVQSMPAKGLCGQLILMSQALQQAVRIISTKGMQVEQSNTYRKVLLEYHLHARQDHTSVLGRKQLIEARKEFIESQRKAKEHQEEQEHQAEAERLAKESKRLAKESKRLEKELQSLAKEENERVRKENEDMNKKREQEKLNALKKTPVGVRTVVDIIAKTEDSCLDYSPHPMEISIQMESGTENTTPAPPPLLPATDPALSLIPPLTSLLPRLDPRYQGGCGGGANVPEYGITADPAPSQMHPLTSLLPLPNPPYQYRGCGVRGSSDGGRGGGSRGDGGRRGAGHTGGGHSGGGRGSGSRSGRDRRGRGGGRGGGHRRGRGHGSGGGRGRGCKGRGHEAEAAVVAATTHTNKPL